MTTKIQKWGNSLAVRIPKRLAKALDFRQGKAVRVRHEGVHLIIEQAPAPHTKHDKNDWEQFVIPSGQPKANVSGRIDEILYGKKPRG